MTHKKRFPIEAFHSSWDERKCIKTQKKRTFLWYSFLHLFGKTVCFDPIRPQQRSNHKTWLSVREIEIEKGKDRCALTGTVWWFMPCAISYSKSSNTVRVLNSEHVSAHHDHVSGTTKVQLIAMRVNQLTPKCRKPHKGDTILTRPRHN